MQFTPVFEKAAAEFEPNIRLLKLDTEAEQAIAAKWAIRSIPTLILLQRGKEVARSSGVMPLGQLKLWLQQHAITV
jgi:thioredoxin 2